MNNDGLVFDKISEGKFDMDAPVEDRNVMDEALSIAISNRKYGSDDFIKTLQYEEVIRKEDGLLKSSGILLSGIIKSLTIK